MRTVLRMLFASPRRPRQRRPRPRNSDRREPAAPKAGGVTISWAAECRPDSEVGCDVGVVGVLRPPDDRANQAMLGRHNGGSKGKAQMHCDHLNCVPSFFLARPGRMPKPSELRIATVRIVEHGLDPLARGSENRECRCDHILRLGVRGSPSSLIRAVSDLYCGNLGRIRRRQFRCRNGAGQPLAAISSRSA